MAPKKNRCNFKECPSAAQRIVGDCGFCQGHFCSKHRLLEDHKCDGLEDVGFPGLGDLPQLSTSSSSSPFSSAPSSRAVSPFATPKGPQWWLVGLCDSLASDDMADLFRPSAKSNRTSETLHSSKVSGPRSLRVFDENYDDYDEDETDYQESSRDTIMGGT
jgi:hypothetical protein